MKNSYQFQVGFFDYLETLLPEDEKFTIWLSELLEIDVSNVYRRKRGEKALSFEEYSRICQSIPKAYFYLQKNIFGDSLISGSINHFQDWGSLEKYFEDIIGTLEYASSKNHILYYVARDLPFFYFYSDPVLIKYKLSIWMMSAGSRAKRDIPDGIVQLGTEVFNTYLSINSTELWYPWGIHNQLEQLRYWKTMDYISIEEFERIKHSLVSTLSYYESWLSGGEKPRGGKIMIYGSDFCIMNNAGLLETDNFQVLMNGFQGVHFINTASPNAISIFRNHWDSHLENAEPLSTKRLMYTFFNKIKKHVNELEV